MPARRAPLNSVHVAQSANVGEPHGDLEPVWHALAVECPPETSERNDAPGVTAQVIWKALEQGDDERRGNHLSCPCRPGWWFPVVRPLPETVSLPFKFMIGGKWSVAPYHSLCCWEAPRWLDPQLRSISTHHRVTTYHAFCSRQGLGQERKETERVPLWTTERLLGTKNISVHVLLPVEQTRI